MDKNPSKPNQNRIWSENIRNHLYPYNAAITPEHAVDRTGQPATTCASFSHRCSANYQKKMFCKLNRWLISMLPGECGRWWGQPLELAKGGRGSGGLTIVLGRE